MHTTTYSLVSLTRDSFRLYCCASLLTASTHSTQTAFCHQQQLQQQCCCFRSTEYFSYRRLYRQPLHSHHLLARPTRKFQNNSNITPKPQAFHPHIPDIPQPACAFLRRLHQPIYYELRHGSFNQLPPFLPKSVQV